MRSQSEEIIINNPEINDPEYINLLIDRGIEKKDLEMEINQLIIESESK